jgi:hypothetical protein
MGNNSAGKFPWMDSEDIAAVIIGLGFLALVAIIFVVTLQRMTNVDDFLLIWSAVGPIVGVVIGAMPAHFFRNMAKTANDQAYRMAEHMANMANTGGEAANTGADNVSK